MTPGKTPIASALTSEGKSRRRRQQRPARADAETSGHFTTTHTYAHAGHYKLTVTLTDLPHAVTTKSITETIS